MLFAVSPAGRAVEVGRLSWDGKVEPIPNDPALLSPQHFNESSLRIAQAVFEAMETNFAVYPVPRSTSTGLFRSVVVPSPS